MKTKILVTGAGGQLGKTIEELYKDNDQDLGFVFTNKTILDIANKVALEEFFLNNKFDYCINCAAYTDVEQAEKTPKIAFKVNAEGVKNLAEACKDSKTVLIHISTDYVFDGEKEAPYTIDDIPNPINEYGKSKLLGEHYIQDILDQYFIVRTSWLYSKIYGHNFYRTILKKAKTEQELFIAADQIGCPTNTVNLSNFIISLIQNKQAEFGLHHFCDDDVMTWYDFAKKIIDENGLISKIKLHKTKKYVTFAVRPKYSVLAKS
ncbi:dTDP-4-dehydrorhamnose reductase [Tamlana sp. 2201CG12-4]|uniref:dTDP-4-dehydrorhamnose reductase n=1 Tax=Tamlana sp. 2201CG12-4 TaxID=3112582 RepID=UPI002DB6BCDE|nr:dTDP-4-dehydrorhamnose reductase [Tamlana sp. 2201CG12-4]MEC3906292.1 dTDP-4-dehydrorhamnose reductase [Tamlana sp. 2201CG12-4]